MNKKNKTPVKSVHILFEKDFYDELKIYAEREEKPISLIIKKSVRDLMNSGSSIIALVNRLNVLEEEVINLRINLEELQK